MWHRCMHWRSNQLRQWSFVRIDPHFLPLVSRIYCRYVNDAYTWWSRPISRRYPGGRLACMSIDGEVLKITSNINNSDLLFWIIFMSKMIQLVLSHTFHVINVSFSIDIRRSTFGLLSISLASGRTSYRLLYDWNHWLHASRYDFIRTSTASVSVSK